ncbi:hypothetical protein C4J81_18875 (plasmid) [Deltaproteobacteria bacterium Smac51]|nr:hypothetical protein C4J81_18875 [Deltaproteobacteria bacterium Smac51]
MILSFKHKFIYIKTMKTGGTSTELALSSICGPDDVITPVLFSEEIFRKQRYGQYCRNFHREKREEQAFIEDIENEMKDSGSATQFNMRKDSGMLFWNHMALKDVLRTAAEIYPDCRLDNFLIIFNVREPHDLMRSLVHFAVRQQNFLLKDCDMVAEYRAFADEHFRRLAVMSTISEMIPVEGYEKFNHHIIKYETLQTDFNSLLDRLALDHIELPVTKKSTGNKNPKELFSPEEMGTISRLFRAYGRKFGYEQLAACQPVYSPGTELLFDSAENSLECLSYFTEGLSHTEPDLPFVWSLGYHTEMEMRIEQEISCDLIVSVEFGCSLGPLGQHVIFYANGEQLGRTVVSENHGLLKKFRIPKRLLKDKNLFLRFEYPGAVSPAELYGGTDTRILAVGYNKMVIREDDGTYGHKRIIIISTPRSGNNWVRRVLRDAFELRDTSTHNIFDLPTHLPEDLILQIHWYREPTLQALIKDQEFKPIVIARHPLDILISVLHFARHDRSPARWLEGNAEIPADLGSATPASKTFLDFALGWGAENLLCVTYQWWHEPSAIKLRYEDLAADPIASFQSLGEQLGRRPVLDWAEALSKNSLKKFQSLRNKHGWQGRPGLWRELLTPKAASLIYQRHKRVFDVLGYDIPAYELTEYEAERNWETLKA